MLRLNGSVERPVRPILASLKAVCVFPLTGPGLLPLNLGRFPSEGGDFFETVFLPFAACSGNSRAGCSLVAGNLGKDHYHSRVGYFGCDELFLQCLLLPRREGAVLRDA
jgi:hypothetical protein